MQTFIRTLAAAVAIAAIAAPASLARPIDSVTPQTQEPATEAPAPEAAARPLDRYTPEAQDSASGTEAPLYWSYSYEAGVPQDRLATTSDDTPWAIVGLAIAGACLLVAGAAMASRSRVRARRARVAA
jgi:hypothetical protein